MIRMILLLLSLSFSAIATEEAYQFDNQQQRQLFKQLSEELRCPKCQNQNIADSNALVSKDMKDKVYDLLKQGYNRDQVLNYMIDRYGYFVHYQPPKTGATAILWLAPVVIIVVGFFAIFILSRRKKTVSVDLSEADKILSEHKDNS